MLTVDQLNLLSARQLRADLNGNSYIAIEVHLANNRRKELKDVDLVNFYDNFISKSKFAYRYRRRTNTFMCRYIKIGDLIKLLNDSKDIHIEMENNYSTTTIYMDKYYRRKSCYSSIEIYLLNMTIKEAIQKQIDIRNKRIIIYQHCIEKQQKRLAHMLKKMDRKEINV